MSSAHFQNFETDRLRVSHWGASLADAVRRVELEAQLKRILTAPVLKDLPPSMQLMQDDAVALAQWIDARTAESDVYEVTARETQQLLGLLILVRFEDGDARPVLHLGYLFSQEAWGQGYASELVQGLVATAQNGPPCTLSGGVALNNPASARVLIKAGFARDAAQSTGDTDVFTLQAGKHE